jgi:hypothetical protein
MSSGTFALIMLIVALMGGAFLAGAWALRELKSFLPHFLVASFGGTALLWIGTILFTDVFSWEGLAYTFGYGPGTNLEWPGAVRVTTLALLAETVVLAAWAADFYVGRGPRSGGLYGWLWAHVSAPARLGWHGCLAPLMALRDRAYRRGWGWPTRPKHRFELATMCGQLVADVGYGIAACTTAARRLQWKRLLRVNRTMNLPANVTPPLVVDGDFDLGEVLHTWAAGDAIPKPRTEETVEA